MAYIGSSYLIGLFFASFFNFEINLSASVAIFFCTVLITFIYKSKYIRISVCMLSVSIGLFIYGIYDYSVYHNITKYDGQNVEIKGKIIDFTEYSGDKSAYIINGVINGDVRAVVTCYTDSYTAGISDSVSIIGKAEIPEDNYVFPTKSYYKSKGIFLQINGISHFNYIENTGFSLRKTVFAYREYILDVMNNFMDNESCGVMAAMLFGDKTGIESAEKSLMYRAGIGHIMAVSGVHLSVVCSFLRFFISRFITDKKIRFALLLIPIFCFVLLAGMSNSVIRAAVMIIIVYGSELFKRRSDTFNSLGIAVIILTITSPFAVRDSSFLLSVAGVFGIGVAAPVFIKTIEKRYKLGKCLKSLASSFCVMVIVFPVTMLFFDEVSVISPLSNLILIPLCEEVLIGGIIVTITGGAAFIAAPVLKICEVLCHIIADISCIIGSFHFSYIPLGFDFAKISVIAALVLIVVSFLFFRKSGHAVIAATVILTALMLCINLQRFIPDETVNVSVICDNNAAVAVIHDKKSACIIDLCGGGMTASNAVKYLNRNGIYRIEAVVLNSEVNTSLPIYEKHLELFDINTLMVPENDRNLLNGNGIGENLTFYNRDESAVEIVGCIVAFGTGGTLTVQRGTNKIILYNSDTYVGNGEKYDASVCYDGKACEDLNSSAVNDGAITDCISESVIFTIDSKENMKSKALV